MNAKTAKAAKWRTLCGLGALCILLIVSVAGCSGRPALFRQYEYEEEIYLALDGSATVYVNSSLAALNALRGSSFDIRPASSVDLAAVRTYYTSPATRVLRVSQSRRSNRRFAHIRLEIDDITTLSNATPFAWSTYQFTRDGEQLKYLQTVGQAAGKDAGNVGWNGSEIVAFRLHLPSRIRYHNTRRDVGRGNILAWEQPLADRQRSVPVVSDGGKGSLDARMDAQSILYTTLWLFGVTFLLVGVVLCGIIWWIMRRGASEKKAV